MAEQEELTSSDVSEDLLSDASLDAAEAEPGPETPQPEPEVEVAVEPGTEVTVTPDEDKTEIEVTPPETTAEEKKKFFGKYETEEAAQEAWLERERFLTQTRQELADKSRSLEELQAFREQAEPVLNQILAAQQAQTAKVEMPQPPADFDWTDPEQVRDYYGKLTQAQQEQFQTALQTERQRMTEHFQAQSQQVESRQAEQAFARTVQDFRTKHQDIDDVKALQIAEVFKENQEYGFTVTPENLEVAHQVVSTPGVKQLLDRFAVVPDPHNVARAQEVLADESVKGFVLANPSAFTDTDDEGWQAAKDYAARLSALQIEPTPTADPKTMAKVTTGTGGAPAPAAPANNPYGIDPEQWKEFGGELGNDPLAGLFNQ